MLTDNGVASQNPITAMCRRLGKIALLLVLVGLALGGVSWWAAPECKITIPDPCLDDYSYCTYPDIFSPAKDCDLQATDCLQTCGCCSSSPESWCPGAKNSDTPFSINLFSDGFNGGMYFLVFFIVFSVLNYWRLCRAPSSPAKTRMICLATVSTIVTFAIIEGVCYLFHITDCHGEFRGFSDVFLMLAILCLFFAYLLTFVAGATASSAAAYDTLIASVRDSRSRSDPNMLVLNVSEQRIRRFLDEEENEHVQLTVTRERSLCAQCCRAFYIVYVIALLVIAVFFGLLQTMLDSRFNCFILGILSFFVILMAWARIRRTQGALDHAKRKELAQWRQGLSGPQQLMFFHNQSDANLVRTDAASIANKSVIALGGSSSFAQRCSFFSPSGLDVPGMRTSATYTRIVGDALELRSVVRVQSPGMLRAATRVESTTRLPIDLNQVAQVREWLAVHRDIFEFETAPDVELAQAA